MLGFTSHNFHPESHSLAYVSYRTRSNRLETSFAPLFALNIHCKCMASCPILVNYVPVDIESLIFVGLLCSAWFSSFRSFLSWNWTTVNALVCSCQSSGINRTSFQLSWSLHQDYLLRSCFRRLISCPISW